MSPAREAKQRLVMSMPRVHWGADRDVYPDPATRVRLRDRRAHRSAAARFRFVEPPETP